MSEGEQTISRQGRSPSVNTFLGILIGIILLSALISYQLFVSASGWGQFVLAVVLSIGGYIAFKSLRMTGGLMVLLLPVSSLIAVEMMSDFQRSRELPSLGELSYSEIQQWWPFFSAESSDLYLRGDQRAVYSERQADASDGTRRDRKHVAFPIYPKGQSHEGPVFLWAACVGTGTVSCHESFLEQRTDNPTVHLINDVDLVWHRDDVLRAVHRAATTHSISLPSEEERIILVEPRINLGNTMFWKGIGGFCVLHGIFAFIWVVFFIVGLRKRRDLPGDI